MAGLAKVRGAMSDTFALKPLDMAQRTELPRAFEGVLKTAAEPRIEIHLEPLHPRGPLFIRGTTPKPLNSTDTRLECYLSKQAAPDGLCDPWPGDLGRDGIRYGQQQGCRLN